MQNNLFSGKDRRIYFRIKQSLPIEITYKDFQQRRLISVNANTETISLTGISFISSHLFPSDINSIKLNIKIENGCQLKFKGEINWKDEKSLSYGVEFGDESPSLLDWIRFFNTFPIDHKDRRVMTYDRRVIATEENPISEKRKIIRRISDLWGISPSSDDKEISRKIKIFKRQKGLGHSREAVDLQREWLSIQTGVELKHTGYYSVNPEDLKGNIENMIGVAQVPIGIAGPLKVNGKYAKGSYYVPMATTEGSLVYTYTMGMQLISLAGGANTTILNDELHMSSFFSFNSLKRAEEFTQWVKGNFLKIKEHAEKATRNGKLLSINPHILDKNVILKFNYSTGDAMGMNMTTFATEAACKYINPIVKPDKFYLQANFSAIKKVTALNFISGYGKNVIAEVVIPRKIISRILMTSPEKMVDFYNSVMLGATHAGMFGMTGHAANAIAAIYIACGQDVANVVNSHLGVINYEVTQDGDLYASIKLPNLLIGTVGGGTNIGTQIECLKLLDCLNSSKKFSEIVVAATLAGEIIICANIAHNTFASVHKKYGIKKDYKQNKTY